MISYSKRLFTYFIYENETNAIVVFIVLKHENTSLV